MKTANGERAAGRAAPESGAGPASGSGPGSEPGSGSRQPLPDFTGVDVTALSVATHPVLARVSADLLAWWPTPGSAVAEFGDSPTGGDAFPGDRGQRERPLG